ncbi:MAG: IS66 family transposase, partial [gamma proteobacterium symbiont of Taylorina sp.]|nr:IS66 family transposase [gamma proteobacterium symbiont of Taylorina sp.]
VAFTWSNTRGSIHVEQQLNGFQGTLLSDGYQSSGTCFTGYSHGEKKLVILLE